MPITKKTLLTIICLLALLGLVDALYLTIEHFNNVIPPCSIHWWLSDCGKVLRSPYSVVFGIPLALIGVIHYSIEFILSVFNLKTKKRWVPTLFVGMTWIGLLSSLYFVYLMLFMIRAICLYCMASALISLLLFILASRAYPRGRFWLLVSLGSFLYRYFAKPFFFKINPEKVHVAMTRTGEIIGNTPLIPHAIQSAMKIQSPMLSQKMHGLTFDLPVGLAAGFDYEAQLTQILGPVGFGFQTVGTITNEAYSGNPRPMLGRLPNSQSLMVNKGFKNPGAAKIIQKLTGLTPPIPVGVSIGRTNSQTKLLTQKQSVADICIAFEAFEKSSVSHSFYELNISCPNLFGDVSFYPPKNLEELLQEVDTLKLTRPVFVKMPIDKSLIETKAMLTVISRHSPMGVIFGNLQKNRVHRTLNQEEVAQFKTGNFSGKPTFDDSNERIALCYQTFGSRFTIIGCGGVFSGHDAYEKITRGASLIQLITGMIYEGPQLITQISLELEEILKKKGYSHLSQAVGSSISIKRKLD